MIRDQKDSTFGKKSNVWLLFEFRNGALLTFKRFFVEGVGYLRTVSREKTAVLLDFVQITFPSTSQTKFWTKSKRTAVFFLPETVPYNTWQRNHRRHVVEPWRAGLLAGFVERHKKRKRRFQ